MTAGKTASSTYNDRENEAQHHESDRRRQFQQPQVEVAEHRRHDDEDRDQVKQPHDPFSAAASPQDGVEHVASTQQVGSAERIMVLGIGGMAQAVEDGGRKVLGPHPSLDGVGADAVG